MELIIKATIHNTTFNITAMLSTKTVMFTLVRGTQRIDVPKTSRDESLSDDGHPRLE